MQMFVSSGLIVPKFSHLTTLNKLTDKRVAQVWNLTERRYPTDGTEVDKNDLGCPLNVFMCVCVFMYVRVSAAFLFIKL